MDEKLMIGTELFEYISDLTDVAAELLAAKSVAEEMLTILQGEDTYEGKAREILITYTQILRVYQPIWNGFIYSMKKRHPMYIIHLKVCIKATLPWQILY
jgi:hypothetical protein